MKIIVTKELKHGNKESPEKNFLASIKTVKSKVKYQTHFEILGWCPAGPVLPHGEKVPL